MFDAETTAAATATLEAARKAGLMIATAESCTGGLVAGALTEIAGSSDVVERGFITYSNAAKSQLLGVTLRLIQTHGAVSEAVARAMAEGALTHSEADIAVAITGVAGPGGGTAEKPVGLVCFALAMTGRETHSRARRYGGIGRARVRHASVLEALGQLRAAATVAVYPPRDPGP